MDGVKILPPDLRSNERSSANPLTVLERRANFARAYIARGRRDGQGQKLDPVLASHLGLQEPAE